MAGFGVAAVSLLVSLAYLVYKLLFWNQFRVGTAPVVIGLFFFGSVQLIFIGLLGEYIGAVHTQILKRPLVVELERFNFQNTEFGSARQRGCRLNKCERLGRVISGHVFRFRRHSGRLGGGDTLIAGPLSLQCGRPEPPPLDASVIGPPLESMLRNLIGDHQMTRRAAEEFRAHYDSAGYRLTRTSPGVEQLLSALQDDGVRLHVLTNKLLG